MRGSTTGAVGSVMAVLPVVPNAGVLPVVVGERDDEEQGEGGAEKVVHGSDTGTQRRNMPSVVALRSKHGGHTTPPMSVSSGWRMT